MKENPEHHITRAMKARGNLCPGHAIVAFGHGKSQVAWPVGEAHFLWENGGGDESTKPLIRQSVALATRDFRVIDSIALFGLTANRQALLIAARMGSNHV